MKEKYYGQEPIPINHELMTKTLSETAGICNPKALGIDPAPRLLGVPKWQEKERRTNRDIFNAESYRLRLRGGF